MQGKKIDIHDELSFEISSQEGSTEICRNSVHVSNMSEKDIGDLWIAGSNSESFRLNWLGKDSIAFGAVHRFVVTGEIYDLQSEDCAFGLLRV